MQKYNAITTIDLGGNAVRVLTRHTTLAAAERAAKKSGAMALRVAYWGSAADVETDELVRVDRQTQWSRPSFAIKMVDLYRTAA